MRHAVRLVVTALPVLAAAWSAPAQDAIAGFCQSRGGTISTEPAANGNAERFCTLKSGTHINAVAYFRNEHRTHH